MTTTYTAPGVYVVELPSGSRTITGVSTSLTAFVGAAKRGPVETPTRIFGFAEFERVFGGLWTGSEMSQAVRQYFLNGGGEALIVRAINRGTTNPSSTASVVVPTATSRMLLRATSEATALTNFDHLEVTVTPAGATTFTLGIAAKDASGTTLTDGAAAYAVSLTLDLSTDDVEAVIAAASTTTTTPIALAKVAEDADGEAVVPTAVPDAATVDSEKRGGIHYAALSTTATMTLAVPAATATALTELDHVRLEVSNATGTSFDLSVSARDASGAVVEHSGVDAEYELTVNLASVAADLSGATTPAPSSLNLITLSGSPMSVLPAEGWYVTSGASREATLARGVRLGAANAGAWGNGLRAGVSIIDATAGAFHLTIREVDEDDKTLASETFYNVTTGSTDTRALDKILERESVLAEVLDGMDGDPMAVADGAVFHSGANGDALRVADLSGSKSEKTGMYALLDADIFNLLCIPRSSWSLGTSADVTLWSDAAKLCSDQRAFLIVDPPTEWDSYADATDASSGASTLSLRSPNAALYFPRVRAADPLQEGRLREFPPCGAVAGIMARTDGERGVWKAPAGTDAYLLGVPELTVKLSDGQQGTLNQLGVNCIRGFPVYGNVVWGARTLRGADALASEWKYVPVRRLALYLEESLYRGMQWAVFEPNDEPLWGQIRQTIRGFLQGLYRQGAFFGKSPREAYFIKCDRETTTQADIDRGVVNVVVGFAPVRPAEFVIIKIQQLAGQATA